MELAELASDPGYEAAIQKQAALWNDVPPDLDLAAWQETNQPIMADAEAALRAGMAPDDPAARPIADRYVELSAAALGRPDDATFRRELLERYRAHDPRPERWWELVAILRGWPSPASMVAP